MKVLQYIMLKLVYKLREKNIKYFLGIRVKPFGQGLKIFSDQELYDLIKTSVETGHSLLIGKFGGSEMYAMRSQVFGNVKDRKKACDQLCLWSGFFPNEYNRLEQYLSLMKSVAAQIDILVKWDKPCEDYFIRRYCSTIKGFCYNLGVWGSEEVFPWTLALKGKIVLVIHPFEKSIISQYKRRQLLFENPNILPDFELKTLKAIQTQGNQLDERFTTWFEALEYMCKEVDNIEFDIALIGCGAYGLPLGAYIKGKGKVAIHMGGDLQMLFGIMGKRWENDFPKAVEIRNEYWIRPDKSETPQAAAQIEDGCYW